MKTILKRLILLLICAIISALIIVAAIYIWYLIGRKFNPIANVELQVESFDEGEIRAGEISFSSGSYSFFLTSDEEMLIETSDVVVLSDLFYDGVGYLDEDVVIHIKPNMGSVMVIVSSDEWGEIEDPTSYSEYDALELLSKYNERIISSRNENGDISYYYRKGGIDVSTKYFDSKYIGINEENVAQMEIDDSSIRVNPVHWLKLRGTENWMFNIFGNAVKITKSNGDEFTKDDGILGEGIKEIDLMAGGFHIDCGSSENTKDIYLWTIGEVNGNTNNQTEMDNMHSRNGVDYFITTVLADRIDVDYNDINSISGKINRGNLEFKYFPETNSKELNQQRLFIKMTGESDGELTVDYPELLFEYRGNVKEAVISDYDLFPNIQSFFKEDKKDTIIAFLVAWGGITAFLFCNIIIKYNK